MGSSASRRWTSAAASDRFWSSPARFRHELIRVPHQAEAVMTSFEPIDYSTDDFVRFYDELPLWSAPFGLLVLQQLPLHVGDRILDVGAGTGFLTVELAQRCGPSAHVVAVDPWASALRRLQAKI